MIPRMDRCLKCNSDRIAQGTIDAIDGVPVFAPEGQSVLSRLWNSHGTVFTGAAFACLDCGLVWGSTSPEDLRKYIQKRCGQKPTKSAK